MKKTAKKAPAKPPKGEQIAPSKKLEWHEVIKGERWLSLTIPEGETICARVQRASRNTDGSFTYFAYRNGRLLGATKDDLEGAQRMSELGIKPETTESESRIQEYIRLHPTEIPPFLLLTQEERRAVWAQYPACAPSPARLRMAEPRKDEDPATAALRAERLAAQATKGRVRAAGTPRAPREAVTGPLRRLREGNPKKAGSAAHGRWASLLTAADAGTAAEAWVAAGGNPDTLANAVRMGWVAAGKE